MCAIIATVKYDIVYSFMSYTQYTYIPAQFIVSIDGIAYI